MKFFILCKKEIPEWFKALDDLNPNYAGGMSGGMGRQSLSQSQRSYSNSNMKGLGSRQPSFYGGPSGGGAGAAGGYGGGGYKQQQVQNFIRNNHY